MEGFWTIGILILAGGFAVLLILNPNMSWTVKRFAHPIYPLLSCKKGEKAQNVEDYGFGLSEEAGLPKSGKDKDSP